MKLSGSIKLPGDKSLSHRSLMFASLANGHSIIENIGSGQDIQSTINCLRQLGIKIQYQDYIAKLTGSTLRSPLKPLDCGNSGTTVRLLMGLLAGQGISAEFQGDSSLSRRPMARVTLPLHEFGAEFKLSNNCLPGKLWPSSLVAIQHQLTVPSAQVKSALILAALGAKGISVIEDPFKTRDHTENLLQAMGANLKINGQKIFVEPLSKPLNPLNWEIPADPSSIAFFAAAAIALPGSCVEFKNALMNPTRTGFLDLLEQSGANFERRNQRIVFGEKICDLVIRSSSLKACRVEHSMVPSLVDEIPILAVLATRMKGRTVVRGANELRVKECDRINAIVNNLRALGVVIEEFEDGFAIQGPQALNAARIRCYDDHRIAMAFQVAGLLSNQKIILDQPECAAISLPQFYDLLESLKSQ